MFEDKNIKKIALSELGEFKLIEHLTKNVKISRSSTCKGVGDDAAILDFSKKKVVLSTDMLVEGVHFNLSYVPLKHLGYKAVIVGISDIYAMNALATHITVSIAVSSRFPLEALEELYEGIYLASKTYDIDVIGGDTTSSKKGLIISITAIGEALERDLVYRNGAKENDLLVVSGDLGAAYLGLQVLERERQVFQVNPNNQPDLHPYTYLIERQLKPEARKDIPPLLKTLGISPTSMIDISDGLSSEILHLVAASGVGCHLYEDKIPLDSQMIQVCEEFGVDSTTIALGGGEDYELLFTISQDSYLKIKKHSKITIIGHMTQERKALLITRLGDKLPLKAQGWNGFLQGTD